MYPGTSSQVSKCIRAAPPFRPAKLGHRQEGLGCYAGDWSIVQSDRAVDGQIGYAHVSALRSKLRGGCVTLRAATAFSSGQACRHGSAIDVHRPSAPSIEIMGESCPKFHGAE